MDDIKYGPGVDLTEEDLKPENSKVGRPPGECMDKSDKSPVCALKLLEEWKYASKARWVEISRDNGFGACGWSVKLGVFAGGAGKEVEYYEGINPDTDDWDGLEVCIVKAIELANKHLS